MFRKARKLPKSPCYQSVITPDIPRSEADLQRGKLEELREQKESCDKELDEALEAARANTLAIREALETEAISDKQAITECKFNLCAYII